MGGRLLTVSNRGPCEFQRDASGKVVCVPGQGGLATALREAAKLHPTTWLSSTMNPLERAIASGEVAAHEMDSVARFVATSQDEYALHYGVFANQVLWFLQHGLAWPEELTAQRRLEAWRDGYQRVNKAFAHKVIEELDTGAYRAVMFHDYHLYLAPAMVRRVRPQAYLQQFIHIPWPEPEAWRCLEPEILRGIIGGLLGNDSLIFQTEECVRNFLRTCEEVLPLLSIDLDAGCVRSGDRTTRVWANGISVDPEELAEAAASHDFARYRYLLRADPGVKTILRVDRVDPSKNVLRGFEAYEKLLTEHPELRGKVSFLALMVPSKSEIEAYSRYREETTQLISSINRRFGDLRWKPIRVLFEHNRLQALAAMSLYDVLLVNSVADGMNLVAKEGPMLNQHHGVLVLSERAGAYDELACGALGIDPLDVGATAAALYEALTMPIGDRRKRSAELREAIQRRDLNRWFRALLADVERHAPARATSAA
jgi:trehalose 6-phosphate synthase